MFCKSSGVLLLVGLVALALPMHSIPGKAEDVRPSAAPSRSEPHSLQQRDKTMPAGEKHPSATPTSGVVNWDPPTKRDLVERAVSDGMTDPARIVDWAKNYKVTMTVEEVLQIRKDLAK